MLITTTDSIEGHAIEQYLGLVTGEAVFGISFLADLAAGFKDLVGGRVESYEKELETAKNNAMAEMVKEAHILGAHAVVGVDIDYMEFLGKYFMVVMNGTAVKLVGHVEKTIDPNYVMPVEQHNPQC